MSKWNSRKYQSTWNLTWLTTALLVVPWIVNAIFSLTLPVLIPADTWSMIIMALWTAYFTANTATKGVYAWEASKGIVATPTTIE